MFSVSVMSIFSLKEFHVVIQILCIAVEAQNNSPFTFVDEACPYLKAQNTLLSILADESYNPLSQPAVPVSVNVSMLIRDIGEINEPKRYTSFLLVLRQTWIDSRLVSILPHSCSDDMMIPLHPTLNHKIWQPPTRLPNAIDATTVESPFITESFSVTPRGKVSYQRTFEATIPCVTDYVKFPFDSILCDLLLGTYDPPVLSTLITSTFQYGTVAADLPKVGYLKGIDLWMIGGIGLVFFAMMEYSILVYIGWCCEGGKKKIRICSWKMEPIRMQTLIDKVARVLYLVLLVTFLACYIVFFVLSGGKTQAVFPDATDTDITQGQNNGDL